MKGSLSRIYVDFDDVLCETARGLSELLEAEFGRRVSYEEMRWFDLGRSFGLTPAELKRFMGAAHRDGNIRSLRPVDGARAALAAWRARGCEICVVTGRPPETAAASRSWLQEHSMAHDRIFFVDKYGRLRPGPGLTTLDALAGMDFAFAIDDAPTMLEFLVGSMPMPVIVYDRPWNSGFPAERGAGGRVLRCGSWDEIARRAEDILGA